MTRHSIERSSRAITSSSRQGGGHLICHLFTKINDVSSAEVRVHTEEHSEEHLLHRTLDWKSRTSRDLQRGPETRKRLRTGGEQYNDRGQATLSFSFTIEMRQRKTRPPKSAVRIVSSGWRTLGESSRRTDFHSSAEVRVHWLTRSKNGQSFAPSIGNLERVETSREGRSVFKRSGWW